MKHIIFTLALSLSAGNSGKHKDWDAEVSKRNRDCHGFRPADTDSPRDPGVTVAAYMMTYMDRVVISSAVPVIQQELGLSLVTMGWILSAFRGVARCFKSLGAGSEIASGRGEPSP